MRRLALVLFVVAVVAMPGSAIAETRGPDQQPRQDPGYRGTPQCGPEQQPPTECGPDGEPMLAMGGSHEMVSGDTLWELAIEHYGDPMKWRFLASINDIEDHYLIPIGTEITIPSLDDGCGSQGCPPNPNRSEPEPGTESEQGPPPNNEADAGPPDEFDCSDAQFIDPDECRRLSE